MKNSFNDEYGEILLRKAAILLSEEDEKIYDKLLEDESIVNPNQEELDKKILGMIRNYEKEEKRKQKQRIINKIALKAAIFISVLTIGFAITFTTVDAFRVLVFNFTIEQKEKFSVISLSENDNSVVPSELNDKYYPHYLPEGYEVKSTFISDIGVEIFYVNNNKEIISYSYFGKDATAGIDTENRTETIVLVNGLSGSIFSKNGHRTLVFKSDEHIFIIEGHIAQDDRRVE